MHGADKTLLLQNLQLQNTSTKHIKSDCYSEFGGAWNNDRHSTVHSYVVLTWYSTLNRKSNNDNEV